MGCWRTLVASCSTLESHARLTCGPSQAVGSIFRPPALPLFLVCPCCAKMRIERVCLRIASACACTVHSQLQPFSLQKLLQKSHISAPALRAAFGPAGPLQCVLCACATKKSHCACGLSRELRQVPQEFAGKWCWVLAGDVIHPMGKNQIVRELPVCSDCRVCVASRAPGWL